MTTTSSPLLKVKCSTLGPASAPAATGNAAATAPASVSDHWPPLGAVGKATSELLPGGTAEFFDPATADLRVAFVVSEAGYVPAGSEIVVRQVSGPSIVVRRKE